ncbi:hypothetical protein GCM10009789_32900 [Kribbella sancticallisti]|uniref:Uncharacterized protein n=1 Tax=Kribbella sancticallisti TaxID=460087 RepID=A0ABN2DFZ8_9ACTN
MSTQYRLIIRPELRRHLFVLQQAARSQPGGLRDREFKTVIDGLKALADGREEEFDGRRLGYSPRHHDLRDCAEIKLQAIPESRGDRELGPSHRLIYREFEAEDGGPPYREAVSFEPRRDDRPFIVAAARLNRKLGVRVEEFGSIPDRRPTSGPRAQQGPAAPARQPLPPDLRRALAAASDIAPATGATSGRATRASHHPSTHQHRDHPPERDR